MYLKFVPDIQPENSGFFFEIQTFFFYSCKISKKTRKSDGGNGGNGGTLTNTDQ